MKCALCGKPCQPFEKNTDGTYTHAHCLRPHLVYPIKPTKGEA